MPLGSGMRVFGVGRRAAEALGGEGGGNVGRQASYWEERVGI